MKLFIPTLLALFTGSVSAKSGKDDKIVCPVVGFGRKNDPGHVYYVDDYKPYLVRLDWHPSSQAFLS